MLLEIVREVEHRFVQHAAFGDQKSDEQSTDTPVAIEKRIDRFELHMGQRELDQRRPLIRAMEERFECSERFGHHIMRR